MNKQTEDVEILKWILGQIYRAEGIKNDLEERLARISDERNCPIGGVGYDPMPRSTGTSEGAASIIMKLADVEERIYDQKREIEKCIVRVMDILDYMGVTSIERRICELRYIDMKKWSEVSNRTNLSKSQCHRLLNEGLEAIVDLPRIQSIIAESRTDYMKYITKTSGRQSSRSFESLYEDD